MSKSTTKNRRIIRTAIASTGLATLLATTLVASLPAGASSTSLKSITVKGFSKALATSSSKSLYLLTSEKGGALKCTGACLSTWEPLLVAKSTAKVTLSSGVKGLVGFVARGKKMKQVTYNSFPVYTYVGDKGTKGHAGEGVSAFGGTWELVSATASSSTKTPLKSTSKKPPTTTTTTKSSPTTTTTTKSAPTTTTTDRPAPPVTTTTHPAPPATTTTAPGGGIAY